MKLQSLLAIMALGLTFAITTPAYAEFLDKAAAEKLLKGNTMEGNNFKFNDQLKVYFDPDGIYRRIDDKNNKESGSWKIDSNGMLCMRHSKHMDICRGVQPAQKEGVYFLIKDGKKSVKITKIHPGNPFNL